MIYNSKKESVLLQSWSVHSHSSGKGAILVALAEQIQQLFYTAGAPMIWLLEGKRWRGRERGAVQCSGCWQESGAVTTELSQHAPSREQGGEKLVPLMSSEWIPLPASSLLLEGNSTKAVPVHLLSWCMLYWWQMTILFRVGKPGC